MAPGWLARRVMQGNQVRLVLRASLVPGARMATQARRAGVGQAGPQGQKGETGEPGSTSDAYVTRRHYYSIRRYGTDFPPPFHRESVLELQLGAGNYVLHAKHDGVPDGSCYPEVDGLPQLQLHSDRTNDYASSGVGNGASFDAYFTLDAPASAKLLCGGGQMFHDPGNHSPGYGRRLVVSDARLEVLKVGSLHDNLLPTSSIPSDEGSK